MVGARNTLDRQGISFPLFVVKKKVVINTYKEREEDAGLIAGCMMRKCSVKQAAL